jgi:hypothetical protein
MGSCRIRLFPVAAWRLIPASLALVLHSPAQLDDGGSEAALHGSDLVSGFDQG